MRNVDDDPRCPECGEPIGRVATYCMHCSADLTDERAAADADGDGVWDSDGTSETQTPTSGGSSEGLLSPDGLLDNTLTVVVGIVGGLVVGIIGTVVLAIVTGSGWALLFGLVAWLGATAHLVRRRTVQGAISRSGYAVAVVLLLVPVIALSPVVGIDGGLGGRGSLFFVLLLFVAVPAGIAAVIGWVASQFIPVDAAESTG